MSSSTEKLTPFDFIKAASQSKIDLIGISEDPLETEKQYNGFMVNRGFSYFEDTILHANEMNQRHGIFADAQFKYYLGVLRSRNRFSKWFKAEKSEALDMIQKKYQINRTIAKQYLKNMTTESLESLAKEFEKGGT